MKIRVVIGPALECSQRRSMRGKQLKLGFAHTEQDRLAAGEQRRPDLFESGLLFFDRGLLFLEPPPINSSQDEYHDYYRDRGYQTRRPIDSSRHRGLDKLPRFRRSVRRNHFEGGSIQWGLREDGNIRSGIQFDS